MTGDELRKIRNDAGLTQIDFAKQFGVTTRTYQDWEACTKLRKVVEFAIRYWLSIQERKYDETP